MEIVGGMADVDADVLTNTEPVEDDLRSAVHDTDGAFRVSLANIWSMSGMEATKHAVY